MKHITLIGIAIVLLAAFAAGGGYVWYQQQLRAPGTDQQEPVYVEITLGMSSADIAEVLEGQGLIKNDLAFRLYARLNNLSGDIKAGFYRLSPALTAPEILQKVTEGEVTQRIVRIPGGVTVLDITEVFEKNGFSKKETRLALDKEYDFSVLKDKPPHASLEGYLYPDTYHIGANSSAEELISMVLSNTELKINKDMRNNWKKKNLNVHEGLTLASIVEKEASAQSDQVRIAQVFLSRLKQDRKLEADPTYLYGARITGRNGDVNLNSPYNTYRHKGLPPGPIANPEDGALQAVAKPADTDFLFFVTGKDGVTRFSKNKEQHLQLIDRYGISE